MKSLVIKGSGGDYFRRWMHTNLLQVGETPPAVFVPQKSNAMHFEDSDIGRRVTKSIADKIKTRHPDEKVQIVKA